MSARSNGGKKKKKTVGTNTRTLAVNEIALKYESRLQHAKLPVP